MNKKILVVDDDEGILDALTMVLEDAGYEVENASRSEEIYKKINKRMPDLILLDVLLSGEDGRDICKKLKQDNKTKHIPILMISARPSAKDERLLVGPDDFLAKPFETEELLSKIRMLTKSNA